ncbi:sensor histidine kinase [Streptomyces sp. LaBMicrA B280]|uniref:sensor histidine kinase n=1 Tax=Streptomyces sp. LaBMicrA B280 TaxID=3391001 RepID=UPI003BA72869
MPVPEKAHAEEAHFRSWLLFFGLATLGTALVVVAFSDGPGWHAATAAALLVASQVLYCATARPSLAGVHANSGRAWTFVAVAVVVFAACVTLSPWASMAQFVFAPQVFILLTPGLAAAVVVVLSCTWPVLQFLYVPLTSAQEVQSIATAAAIVVFSLFFAVRMLDVTHRSQERQRLIDALHEREAEVAALSAAQGAEMERARLAREMHDTLAQGFTSIVMLGHAARGELESDPAAARRHVELITATAQENLAESRRIIAALTPARLDGASLPQAVERIAAAFAAETGMAAALRLTGEVVPSAPSVEVVALRVAQEGLANIRKHARAARVDLVLAYAAGTVSVEIRDDGVGFDPDTPSAGYGLAGMRARVEEAGGGLRVISGPGAGTIVRATLPGGSGT